jgi:hypothetical protein
MSWERRKRGSWYYYRSKKIRGRVEREYFGAGRLGQLAALSDAKRRAQLKSQVKAWRAERAYLEAADAALHRLCNTSEAMARGSLILAGYYRHHRGEWRKRGAKKSDCSAK